ncbi:MAG: LamG domain-containing protein, partial [Verrucomicrobia bacterium]|nr:LamG domain-containing protein [Verrucomicrobiota bacterium]
MCLHKLISPIVCLALLGFSDLAGVVKKNDLLARWTFDEGNGSIASDSLNGGSPLFMQGSNWGQEKDGHALSKFSMDISTGEGFALVEANRKFQVTSSYSIMLWFKTNGLPDDYAQLLSKRESTTYSYLFQINPGGTSLEALYRATGQESQYATTGPVYFNLNQWNCFLSTYDGNYLRSYLNGKPTGILELPNTPLKDDADFGVGGSVDGSNLFKGWIDEFRFYSVPLDRDDAVAVYGEGFGDLGARPVIVAPAVNADANSTVYVSFEKPDGTWSSVTQFQASDIEVSGAELTGFQEHNDTHYRFHVVADKKPQRIKIRIPAGSAKDDGNFSTSSGSARIQHLEPITSAKNLVGWWTFNEASNQSWESNSTTPANTDAWTPLTLSPKVWLDAYDLSTLDKGTDQGQLGQPTDGESIQFWADKSGNEHHAKQRAGTPTYRSTDFNSKPTIKLTSASMFLENSQTDFDGWAELTVVAALSHDDANFATLIGKSNHAGWMGNDSDLAWAIFTHRLDGNYNLWGPGIITDTPANYYGNNTGTKELQTQDGGSPGLLVFSYKSESFVLKVNGVVRINHTGLSGNIQEKPNLDVMIGGYHNGGNNNKMQISELLLFDRVLDGNELTLTEISLMDKWNIESSERLNLLDSNQSTFVFEDQSGGDRPMFFYGESQNNQNLFGSTLGFDGGSNFGKIDLLDRNQSTIELADVTLPNLLHAWWPLDGNSQDHSGNERHGQIVGHGAFGMGRFDQALDLQNGGIFRVQEEKDPGIYENFPRTLSMWVKTLSSSGNLVKWGIQEDGKQWHWSITSSNGMGGWMKLGIHGANQTGMHYMVSDGKWRHLAVSMTPIGESSFSLNLFVDGKQETKFLSTINKDNFEINTQPSDLFVGGEGFSGWIDDLRIYSTRLNSGEITMILEEKIDDDLTITRGNYSLSAWIKPTDLPESNRFNFANARFFWRDWAGDTRIDTWPHDMRKTGIPKLDPSSDFLTELFEEPVSFYALAVDNNPNTDAGWNTDYIGYDANSISYPFAFFSDTNLTDGPWLLENENGGTAY